MTCETICPACNGESNKIGTNYCPNCDNLGVILTQCKYDADCENCAMNKYKIKEVEND